MNVHELGESASGAHHAPKKVALATAIFAVVLAIFEVGGHTAQHHAESYRQESQDLWAFYFQKNSRRSNLVGLIELVGALNPVEGRSAEVTRTLDAWTKTAERLRSEPEAGGGKGEGTIELVRRALEFEKLRDQKIRVQHSLRFASTALQVAIVVLSVSVVLQSSIWIFAIGIAAGALGTLWGMAGAVVYGFGLL